MPLPLFAEHHSKYAGQTGWVVGRGPTHYRYEELAGVSGPVFFINDSVGQEKWLPDGHPSFFFAHDRSMAVWLQPGGIRSLPVLITDLPKTGPEGARRPGLLTGPDDPLLRGLAPVITYRGTGPLDPASILDRNREEIRDHGQLYVANGTIHPLLHFAWYVGCAELKLIGCDGLPDIGYDSRLENRSQTLQESAIFIRRRQDILLRRLGLPVHYLGSPHRRIKMIYEMQVELGAQPALRAWAATLMDQFRQAGCLDLRSKDLLASGKFLWINGTWPSLETCVACLASPAHLTLHALGEVLVSQSAGTLRSAYQSESAEGPPGG